MKRHQILIVILFSILIGFAHPLLAAVYSTTEETHISVAITANAEDYTVQSEKQDEIKDYEQAIENYTEAIRLNPNDIDAFFNRSKAYTKLQNYQEAIDDLTEVIRLNPDNAEAYRTHLTSLQQWIKVLIPLESNPHGLLQRPQRQRMGRA